MIVRKNLNNLTSAEKTELVSAIKTLKCSGRYDMYVIRQAQTCSMMTHHSPAFLPWHRQFIADFERDLQHAANNPNLVLPYWHWADDTCSTAPATASVWADDFMGGNGNINNHSIVETGPFRQGQWTIISSAGVQAGPLKRALAAHPMGQTLPTQQDIDEALDTTPYDSSPWNVSSNLGFRNRLEGVYGAGLNNRVLVWVGGSMLAMTSANDPLFFLHHCFIDKL
ncbi:MAG: tyrosinase family protein, partial [Psychrosphaera sp.]|nr:tyrosinase family protein [Psychrosphaera sp.]